jgi:hypothetical protein
MQCKSCSLWLDGQTGVKHPDGTNTANRGQKPMAGARLGDLREVGAVLGRMRDVK